MKTLAQNLRKNMTLEERILWYQYLKTYPVQWNRQKVIGPYIVDFFCKRAKLIVELDGSQHYEPETADYDQKRTVYLNSLGYAVLRFSNTDIKTNLSGVCEVIDRAVKKPSLGVVLRAANQNRSIAGGNRTIKISPQTEI